jgi:hypothetical protein
MKFTKRLGFLLTGIWLILQGLPRFIVLNVDVRITAVLAIAAGILLLLDR